MPELELLVCTYGLQGLERLARTQRPRLNGVTYLVSCQLPAQDQLPADILAVASPELQAFLQRPDVSLHIIHSRGLSKNRNNALRLATAPLALISDDDVDYTAEGLQAVIRAFRNHPQADVISFQFRCEGPGKAYPTRPFNHRCPAKGFYITSIEMAFRRERVQGRLRFNEHFGLGSEHFPMGEEAVLLHDMLKAGLECIYQPYVICSHPGQSTGPRELAQASHLQAKGAVLSYLHPHTYALRLFKEALMNGIKKRVLARFFLANTLKGASLARRLSVFDDPSCGSSSGSWQSTE